MVLQKYMGLVKVLLNFTGLVISFSSAVCASRSSFFHGVGSQTPKAKKISKYRFVSFFYK